MSTIDNILTKFKNHLGKTPCIRGVVVMGSYARYEQDPYSDIDIYLFGDNSKEWEKFTTNPVKLFKAILGEPIFVNYLPPEEKNESPECWMINIPSSYVKIDLHIVSRFNPKQENPKVDLFWSESQINDTARAVLIDKDNILLPYFRKVNISKKPVDTQWKYESEIRNFLFYYEILLTYLHRGDQYRAFFLYNICLHNLAVINYLEEGETRYLYSPANLLEKSIRPTNRDLLIQTSVSLRDDLHVYSKTLYKTFLSLIEKTQYKIPYTLLQLVKHRNQLVKRYETPLEK